jgi:[ribosomal protein S5]-alanine N-acetyltransferase
LNFKLRPWTIDDLQSLCLHANNINISSKLTDRFPHPYTKESGIQFIDMAMSGNPVHIMCIDVNSEAVGGIGIHQQNDIFCKNAEMGYWLSEEYWGKGIISSAISQMIDYGFKNFDIDRIFARPFGSNISSQKVLEKNGFLLEAILQNTIFKNGEYQDELIYGIRRSKIQF